MPPKWEDSALKRGIPTADVVYAIAHATFIDTIEDPGLRGGRVELYIGPEHGQTARELTDRLLGNWRFWWNDSTTAGRL